MTSIEEMNNNYVIETVGRIYEEVKMIRILLDKEGKFAVELPKSRDARSKEASKELEGETTSEEEVAQCKSTSSSSSEKDFPPLPTQPCTKEPETPHELKAPTPNKAIADLRTMFPDNLEALVEFFDRGSYVEVKPLKFLGRDKFDKIMSIIKEAGGNYATGLGHFRVPKTERQKQ